MYVYIPAYICICIYMHIYVYTCIYMYMYMHIHVCMYLYVYAYIYIHVNICIFIYVYNSVRLEITFNVCSNCIRYVITKNNHLIFLIDNFINHSKYVWPLQ